MRHILTILIIMTSLQGSKYAGDFQELGVGARICGMGGTGVAQGNEPSVIALNPAGSVFLKRSFAIMHAENFSGIVKNEFGSLVIPKANSAFGLGLQAVLVNDIKLTRLNDTTTLPGPDNPPIPYDTTATKDIIFYLNGAQKKGFFSYGANLKVYYRNLSVIYGIGGGVDIGCRIEIEGLKMGVVVKDFVLAPVIWDNKSRDFIAPKIIAGIAPEIPFERFESKVIIESDLVKNLQLSGFESNFGIEYNYKNTISGRIGKNGGRFTLGVGLRYKRWDFNYALITHSDLGGSNKFSLGLEF